MVDILLIILVPISSIITGYFTLKAYKQGLTHQWDLKHDIKPTEFKNPIVEVIQGKKEDKDQKNKDNFVHDLLYDPRDEG